MLKFDFDDILLEPAIISPIESRKTINLLQNGMLPLFTAPMDTVVNSENAISFINNKVRVVLPRNDNGIAVSSSHTKLWMSFGLDEFINAYLDKTPSMSHAHYILIDIANGHMEKLLLTVEKAKNKYGKDIVLMVGNVAHPNTYIKLSNAGADYVRIGIGNGGGCLTTQQTGIGYPMASLIRETYEVSCSLKNPAKIVADGGFKKYADIIKALALGADYVMLGSIFNKALESCAETLVKAGDGYAPMTLDNYMKLCAGFVIPGNQHASLLELMYEGKLVKKFRGMSTKEVQKSLGNEVLKTSEGVVKFHQVEYTLEGWLDNFKHYLASAMSYTGCNNLDEFIGKVNFNLITQNAYNRFNK